MDGSVKRKVIYPGKDKQKPLLDLTESKRWVFYIRSWDGFIPLHTSEISMHSNRVIQSRIPAPLPSKAESKHCSILSEKVT